MIDLFRPFDQTQLDALATPLMSAILSMIELAKHGRDETDPQLLEAAVAKAFLTGVAAFIAHPHTDAQQDEEFITGVGSFLRTTVAELRAS